MQIRVAELAGTSQKVRIIREAKNNSRVVLIDPATGEDIGQSFLVESSSLLNAPQAKTLSSRTVRLSGDTMAEIAKHAQPFESPDAVILRVFKSL